jgi:hypothetical protein
VHNIDEVALSDGAGSKANDDCGAAMRIDIRSRISEPVDGVSIAHLTARSGYPSNALSRK